MSTQTAPTSNSHMAESPRRPGRVVAIAALVTAAVVAVTGGVVLTVDANRAASASSASQHTQPSDSIKALQQELAELNFYDGPITGYEGPQTIAAIQNLQRAAHLPQTGQMNSETRAALLQFLAQGDNQMNT
jgi:peptidoglycan hydrolase-like protein with peptidoglycan-binding domain